MARRFVSIWFRHLLTYWLIRRQPDLATVPFVIVAPERGRMMIRAASPAAEKAGVRTGMVLPDARALEPSLEAFPEKPEIPDKLLGAIADWTLKYTPSVCITSSDGLMLDVTGCAHLRGGEALFLKDLVIEIRNYGYDARAAMADTVGAAWAVARYGKHQPLIPSGQQKQALATLPPAALRLDETTAQRLKKLGIRTVSDLYNLPRPAMNRRFGHHLAPMLDKALGHIQEHIVPRIPIEPHSERLTCADGIATAEGIAAALQALLEKICLRLKQEEKGVRTLIFQGLRLDGQWEQVEIGTGLPSRNVKHLFKLFENKLDSIEPALGIELFVLTAREVEAVTPEQNALLEREGFNTAMPELIDRLTNRTGPKSVSRFLAAEHYWPEHSIKLAGDMEEKSKAAWADNRLRPHTLLLKPEPIEVTALIPDDPPMMFRHKGKMHRVRKADGPERIEREWWLDSGQPRDYYRVEDTDGYRYWVYRSGHYQPDQPPAWYLHGFFL